MLERRSPELRARSQEYIALQETLAETEATLDTLRTEHSQLNEDVMRIDNDVRLFKQKAFLKREDINTDWYQKASYALVMKRARLRAIELEVGRLKDSAKVARHSYELHVREGYLAAFHNAAKSVLKPRDFQRVAEAANKLQAAKQSHADTPSVSQEGVSQQPQQTADQQGTDA